MSVERGDAAASQIVAVARASAAGLVVMGTHGRGGFERLLLGSVAEKVLQKVHCPLLIVPPHVAEPSARIFTQVLCPIDFSKSSDLALEYAVSLVERTNGQLIVPHALEALSDEPPEQSRFDLARGR